MSSNIMEPREEGFRLEEIIYNASLQIPGITKSLRENDIKSHFNETSLNGVDHWIQYNNKHVFIQDKWKENIGQQEISQFLQCVDRIKNRINDTSNIYYLIWATKVIPTSYSNKSLKEENVVIIQCDISIESLSRKVIHQLNEFFGTHQGINWSDEERELLKIRNELIEKKKNEKEQNKKDEEKVRELLQHDGALACYLALHGGNCRSSDWKPEYYSVKNLLEGYDIIQKFRESIEPKIKEIIQEHMKGLWDNANTYDYMMYHGNGSAPYERYISINGSIIHRLQEGDDRDLWYHNEDRGRYSTPKPPPIFWKRVVAESIYTPLVNYELGEWTKYVTKFIELSNKPNSQPSPQEAKKKIQSLEDQIKLLKERNEMLEEKFAVLKTLANIE